MKIVCPSCAEVQEIIPDDLIGRYVSCTECHDIFLWEKCVDRQETHQNHKKDQNLKKLNPTNENQGIRFQCH